MKIVRSKMIAHIQKLALFGLALIAFSGSPAYANESWRLVQAVGEVSAGSPGGALAKATPVLSLAPGAMVVTGATGRAVLLRGSESIVMAPVSTLTLPAGANMSLTHVRQDAGVLLFKIGKKPEAHFEVQTPYLAAVVKGTSFTVRVTAVGASVHVLEGAVEVATPDRSRTFLTHAGQISSVFMGAANDIFTAGASAMSQVDLALPASVSDIDRLGLDVMGRDLEAGLRSIAPPAWRDAETNAGPAKKSPAASSGKDRPDGLRGAEKDAEKRNQQPAAQQPGSKQTAKAPRNENNFASGPKPENERSAAPASDDAPEKKKISRTLRLGGVQGQISIDASTFEAKDPVRPKSVAAGSWIATSKDSAVSFKVGPAIFALTENSAAVFDGPAGSESPRFVAGTGCRLDPNLRQFKPVSTMAEERAEHLNRKREADGLLRVPAISVPAERTPEAICAALNGPAEMARRWDEGDKRTGPRTLSLLDKVALGILGLGALGCLAMAAFPSGASRRGSGLNGGDRKPRTPDWMKTILGR